MKEEQRMRHLVALDMLPSSLTAMDIQMMLSVFPGVLRTELPVNRGGGSLGSAIIQVRNSAYRDVVIDALDGFDIFGQTIRASRLDVSQHVAA
jgi:hypothetical protein